MCHSPVGTPVLSGYECSDGVRVHVPMALIGGKLASGVRHLDQSRCKTPSYAHVTPASYSRRHDMAPWSSAVVQAEHDSNGRPDAGLSRSRTVVSVYR